MPALIVGGLGFLLWWGGYYAAMVVAWRAGVRGLGLMVGAAAMGICGCGGIPILGYFWSKVQSKTFEAINEAPDDAPVPRHLPRFQASAAVAVVGMALQLAGGYMLPDDDGYDSYDSYGSDYPGDSYDDRDDSYVDDRDDAYDDRDDSYADNVEDRDDGDDHGADDALAGNADEDEGSADVVDALPDGEVSWDGILVGVAADRRHAAFLVGERVIIVSRAGRARWTGMDPGVTVAVRGREDGSVTVASDVEAIEAAPWAGLPRPHVVRPSEAEPLRELAGRYVLLASPHAISRTRVSLPDGTELTVRAPAGALTRDTDYTAVRGVLVDTSAFGRRGALELWIPRESDVVPL